MKEEEAEEILRIKLWGDGREVREGSHMGVLMVISC